MKTRSGNLPNSEQAFLERGVAKLRVLLATHGFEYDSGDQATSSGGPFAVCFFRRGKLEIGLIVRNRDQLGCPNYTEGRRYAGHIDLFWALGHEKEASLVPGDYLSYKAKDGGDSFDALFSDLEKFILPALQKSRSAFSRAVDRASKRQ